MPDDLIGKTLGGYEILDRIDQGGMATVYRARQVSMNRVVALKILPRHFLRDDTYLRRFEREVEIVAQLEHRNIVPVYDYGEHDGQPYVALRYMPAGSVSDLLKKGPIPLERSLEIIQQVAPALDYAHTKNILHRDLKPSNILLDEAGDVYITDFGIARIFGMESKGTTITTQGVVGTPSYMSPEQAQGKDLDGRSDVYSLGIMLFEMLTGRRPFDNDTPYSIAVMQVTTPPPSPRTFNPNIPGTVEQVIFKALKKRPEKRYNTANELAQAFKLAVERPGSKHDTEPSGIAVRSIVEETQPNPPERASRGQTVPSAPQQQYAPNAAQYGPPPSYAPPPRSSQVMTPATGIEQRFRPRKRGSGLAFSILLGMGIGCGLLTALVIVMIIALNDLVSVFSSPDPGLPTPDLTAQAIRQQVSGIGDSNQVGTPVYVLATEVSPQPTATAAAESENGSERPAPTFDPEFPLEYSQLVYFAERDGNYAIYRYDIMTNDETQIVGGEADYQYPQISPDGRLMAYQSDQDGDFDIFVYDMNSGTSRKLTDNDVEDRLPSWSPDGKWIIFSSDTRSDGGFDLIRMEPDGGQQQIILSDGKRNSHARFSHDGRYIVFTSGEPGDATTWEIVLFEPGTETTETLTNNLVRDAWPVFSPDDSTILYITNVDGGAAVAVLELNDPEDPTILYNGGGYESGGHYTPDGEFIVFTEEHDTRTTATLMVMRADGTGARNINSNGGLYPSWIP